MSKKIIVLVVFFIVTNSAIAGNNKLKAPPVVDTGSISFMTFNVEMLPRIFSLAIHHYPVKRARMIPAHLLKDAPDVIVLQEAFDPKAVRILKGKLKKVYPYTLGPANKGFGFKINSGVMMLSKFPLHKIESIRFHQCSGDDCFARKGALLAELEVNGKKLQLLGTHVQAGGTAEIKSSQYRQIADLLQRHIVAGEPQMICGDFNTFQSDTLLYPLMIKTLQAENGPFSGELKYTSDHFVNDLCDDVGKPNVERDVIDYILYRGNGHTFQSVKRTIIEYLQPWHYRHYKHKYLSDHNALMMQLKW